MVPFCGYTEITLLKLGDTKSGSDHLKSLLIITNQVKMHFYTNQDKIFALFKCHFEPAQEIKSAFEVTQVR